MGCRNMVKSLPEGREGTDLSLRCFVGERVGQGRASHPRWWRCLAKDLRVGEWKCDRGQERGSGPGWEGKGLAVLSKGR